MASTQSAAGNGVVAAEFSVAVSASAEQLVEGEAVQNNGDVAEASAATETKEPDEKEKQLAEIRSNWPGWPGYTVFRIVVPVLKVGGIIGRKGDLIKKLVEETRAKIRVLDGPITSPDRIVLVTGKEEPEAALSPAMDAIIRIFKRVSGLPENDSDNQATAAAGAAFCAFRLLVASTQAISLIGKQGSLIKSIQESSGASVRVLSNDEMPVYATSDERIVELQGEGFKVLKALEAVVGHLRKFLVDHSILPLFEKSYNAAGTQERAVDILSDKTKQHATPQTSLSADYPVLLKRDFYLDPETQIESHIRPSRLSYGQDHGLGSHSSTIGRPGGPVVTQIAQTMQIPLAYAEDIIGVQGANIDFIRRSSGAILTVQESRYQPDEITVEIKGTSSQVQAAQRLIQDFIGGHEEQPLAGTYSNFESSLRSSYSSQLGSSSYPSSTFTGQPYGSYGSSGGGGYSSYNGL